MQSIKDFATNKRNIYFGLAVIAGAGLGLAYGWLVSPVQFYDTAPNTLRIDYQTDYILMVAEVYAAEQDAFLAVRRLFTLGIDNPAEGVQAATVFAVQAGYPPEDLALFRELGDAMRTYNPALEPSGP